MNASTLDLSPKTLARVGGALYVFIIVAGVFGELFVRDALIVSGNAAATAANVAAHEGLWRLGIAGDLLMHVADLPLLAEDRENLDRILQKRRRTQEQYFNLIAGRLGKNYCPGRSWEAIGHLALRLTPAIEIADLGAGEGLVSQLLARRARQVWCIDNSPRMVEVGTELAKKNGLANLAYKLGDLENVPLPDKSVDLAILSQALHHARHPQIAVNEAHRILRPGGQLLVLDLNEHSFEKARELYADVWLGFKESALHGFLKKAGFAKVDVSTVAREANEPHFETLLASGVKPARERGEGADSSCLGFQGGCKLKGGSLPSLRCPLAPSAEAGSSRSRPRSEKLPAKIGVKKNARHWPGVDSGVAIGAIIGPARAAGGSAPSGSRRRDWRSFRSSVARPFPHSAGRRARVRPAWRCRTFRG